MQNIIRKDCRSISKAGTRENGKASVSRFNGLGASAFLSASLLVASGVAGWSQESRDPLLDLMIQKGMLTQEEARKVKAEADAIRTNALNQAMAPADSKWNISKPIRRSVIGWNWTAGASPSGSACAATFLTISTTASDLKHLRTRAPLG
jgi:hypothetical protein